MWLVDIIYITGSMAYVLNAFLIYFIAKYSRKHMGTYKILMLLFAIFNLAYPTVHMVAMPNMHVYKRAFVLFPVGVLYHHMELGHWGMVTYGSLFCLSIVLLALHFVYRYFLICKNHLMFLFNELRFAPILFFIWLGSGILWGSSLHLTMNNTEEYKDYVREAIWDIYNVDVNHTATLGLMYTRINEAGEEVFYWKSCLGFLACMCILCGTFGVIIFCTINIYKTLKTSSMSARAKKLQFDLLKALVIQLMTIIPVLFEYVPCAVTFFTPLLNIPFGQLCNYVPLAVSLYPVLDPISVIYFIKDYRQALYSKFDRSVVSSHTEAFTNHKSKIDLSAVASNSVS